MPADAGDVRDTGSFPELGRSLGGGRGNPLQYPCLENPTDRGVWWATVHRITKTQTQLKQLSTYTHCPKDFPGGTSGQDSPANAGGERDSGSIPGSGRPPGIGNGNTLQYSCHNSIDRVAWRAIFHRVTKSEAI